MPSVPSLPPAAMGQAWTKCFMSMFLVASLLLVVRPGAPSSDALVPSSFLFLVLQRFAFLIVFLCET